MVSVTNSRYSSYLAGKRIHRGKPYLDLVSSKLWKSYLVDGLPNYEYKVAIVPTAMEFRPDLISAAAYGTKNLWWLVCTANAIIDPNTELVAGKQILLPII